MPVLDHTDGLLTLEVGPLQHDLARKVPGLAYKSQRGLWVGTAAWSTALALQSEFRDDLTLAPGAVEWWERMLAREGHASLLKTWQPGEPLAWAADLRDLQTSAVGFLTGSYRALLADDPGAGKGVVVATALGLLDDFEFPALIVCPKSVKWSHARHLELWGPSTTPHVIAGTKPQRLKQLAAAFEGERSVIIMNYEQVREHSMLAPYGSVQRTDKEKEPKELNLTYIPTIVGDEVHRLADPTSKQTRAVTALTHHADRVWFTTATPVPSPIGFWSIMHALTPHDAPSRVKYQDRYCLTETIFAKGGREVPVVRAFNPRTRDELDRWVAPYLMRRTIDQIEPDLPPVVNKTMWVELSGKQLTAYRSMETHMLAETGDGKIIAATNPMHQSLRLLQYASALPVFEEYEDEEGETRHRLVEMTMPSSKVDGVMDWLTDNPGKAVVVFASSRRLIELVGRRLETAKIAHGFVTGTQDEQHRRAATSAFQDGELRVLLGTYGAMSEGITLTAASTQLMLQRSFSPVENVQADGRCRRIGQEASHVEIIEVVSANTYDEDVFESGAYKDETAQVLLRDPGWIRKKLEARRVA